MKKIVLIFVVIAMLLSGCISGSNKSGSNKSGSNGDEYGNDNSMEEDDSGVIQADYHSLDLNNKGLNMSNVQSTIHANKTIYQNTTINTVDKTSAKTSLETIRG